MCVVNTHKNLEKQEHIPKQRERGIMTVRQKKKKREIPQVVRGVRKSEGAERFFYYQIFQNISWPKTTPPWGVCVCALPEQIYPLHLASGQMKPWYCLMLCLLLFKNRPVTLTEGLCAGIFLRFEMLVWWFINRDQAERENERVNMVWKIWIILQVSDMWTVYTRECNHAKE